jgi:hypothetical protein
MLTKLFNLMAFPKFSHISLNIEPSTIQHEAPFLPAFTILHYAFVLAVVNPTIHPTGVQQERILIIGQAHWANIPGARHQQHGPRTLPRPPCPPLPCRRAMTVPRPTMTASHTSLLHCRSNNPPPIRSEGAAWSIPY